VDAITASSYFHVPQLESQGAKLHYFGYADFGVTALEGGVVANSDWLAKNRDLALRFGRATAKAWQVARADLGAAIDAAVRLRPELAKTRDTHVRQLQMSLESISTPGTQGFPLGRMSEKDWQKMVEQLVQSKQLAQPIPVEQLFTNDFVPQ
jgi:NitT/TauT family transport system substrate-binding protein